MMKTFRLFISSTFKDFKIERDLLQTRVFPRLSKLCAEHGYGFLPIDLRWGVTEGTQYDQKTLDLCLGEVRSCTVEPHPDFLILAGDRYGWVPLPYRIEQSEFEELISKIPNDDMPLMKEWYRLDLNQLPATYTLQKREGRFQQYDTWLTVEDSLKSIFQSAVLQTSLDDRTKEKYFTSTTGFEYEEFIHRVEDDQKSIFLLSRIIESNGTKNDVYATDNDRQVVFKNRLKQTISSNNQIELKAILQDTDSFDDSYVKSFVEHITSMLSASISSEIERIKLLESQSENELHKSRMLELSQFVVGRDNELEAINTYVNDPHAKLPFIIYGSSGVGKSAIIAKSISAITTNSTQQVIYRFCGISEQSSSMRSVIISLLGEIGIVIDVLEESDELKSLSSIDEAKIDRVSEAISDALWSIKTPTVIFIDALDQLSDKNQLEWLPSVLPDHLKIVLSALKDDKYAEDEYYYEKLLTLYPENAFYFINTLNNVSIAETIIAEILRGYDRTLQPNQIQYVLSQYAKVNKPLYLKIVCEEICNWDSYTTEFALADDQNSAVKEYIENLSTLYHHDSELVKKVFGYIYATRESLSESQLYEILSNDTDLVSRLEHTDHTNHGHKLPMAVWARLKTHIEPFIREGEGGKLQFFHREFIDGAKSCYNYELSQHLLHVLEQMIENIELHAIHQEITDLHIKVLTTQKKEFPKYFISDEFVFIVSMSEINLAYILKYISKLSHSSIQFRDLHDYVWAKVYSQLLLNLSSFLYKTNHKKWIEQYISSLNNLSVLYFDTNHVEDALKLNNKAYKLCQKFHKLNVISVELYSSTLLNKTWFYYMTNRIEEALKLQEKVLSILKPLFMQEPQKFVSNYTTAILYSARLHQSMNNKEGAIHLLEEAYSIIIEYDKYNLKKFLLITNNLAISYQSNDQLDLAISLEEKAYTSLKKHNSIDSKQYIEEYIRLLNNLSNKYFLLKNIDLAIAMQEEALFTCRPLYLKSSDKWVGDYIDISDNLAHLYQSIGRLNEAIVLCNEALSICRNISVNQRFDWVERYIRLLNNLSNHYADSDRLNEAIVLGKESLTMLEKLYQKNNQIWAEKYTVGLRNLASLYADLMKMDESIALEEKALKVVKENYFQAPDSWIKEYILLLNVLTKYYYDINDLEKGIELQKEGLSELKLFFIKNPQQWCMEYTGFLLGFASLYSAFNQIEEAIKLGEEACTILNENNKDYSELCTEQYVKSLNNVAMSYYDIENFNKAILILEKAVLLLEKLFDSMPKAWADNYTSTLSNLAIAYYKAGKINKVLEYYKKTYEIRKNYFGENDLLALQIKDNYNRIKAMDKE